MNAQLETNTVCDSDSIFRFKLSAVIYCDIGTSSMDIWSLVCRVMNHIRNQPKCRGIFESESLSVPYEINENFYFTAVKFVSVFFFYFFVRQIAGTPMPPEKRVRGKDMTRPCSHMRNIFLSTHPLNSRRNGKST